MTSEEIRGTVSRLKAIEHNSLYNIAYEFDTSDESGCIRVDDFRTKLIDLLQQADPDTHVELPIDADCKPIHLGDRVYEQRGDVVEHPVEVSYMHLDSAGWVVYDKEGGMHEPCFCRHYHKPTVEEVLTRMLDAVADGSVSYDGAVTEYAKLLCLKEEDE